MPLATSLPGVGPSETDRGSAACAPALAAAATAESAVTAGASGAATWTSRLYRYPTVSSLMASVIALKSW